MAVRASLIPCVAALLLLPVGLTGLRAGLAQLPDIAAEIDRSLALIQDTTAALLPWCQAAASVLVGLILVALALGMMWRGLQSGLR
ncbi:MAG: hypothetical protein ACXIUL_11825 [Wenzhouxiangella sp.]